MPDLVARNLTSGRPWYAGFADFVADPECRKHVLNWERKGISGMIGEGSLSGTREEKFVLACHAAWRTRMRQLYERAEREGADRNSLIDRERERLRVAFSRCKNAAALREVVTDFWARAGGSLPGLRDAWREIIPLFDDWRLAKDLTLLALASYSPSDQRRVGCFVAGRRLMEDFMSKHLFGLVITPHGTAANNRGENEGNITTLQKLLWNGEVHTTVSAEAIRWAIRYYWQRKGISVNREWDEDANDHRWRDPKWERWGDYIDDDVLGFMVAEAGKAEGNDAEAPEAGGGPA